MSRKSPEKKKGFMVHLGPSLHQEAMREAAELGLSMSQFTAFALRLAIQHRFNVRRMMASEQPLSGPKSRRER